MEYSGTAFGQMKMIRVFQKLRFTDDTLLRY
jgi:hypothetical protein